MSDEVHITFHNPLTLEVKSVADDPLLANIANKLRRIMALLDDLTAQVTRNTEVQASAVVLLKGLKAKLDAAGTDPAKLKELSDQIGVNTDGLAAAVVENTPAEDAPTPPPA